MSVRREITEYDGIYFITITSKVAESPERVTLRRRKEMARIERQDLLIIDDFGIQPFDHPSRLSLLEIIEDRHGKRSTIFTSQVPVKQWHDIIGEKTVADAVLDRIVHNAHRVELTGASLRRKWNKKDSEESD